MRLCRRVAFRGFGAVARPATWAEDHFRLPSETSSAEGRFRAAPYQRGLVDMMAGDGPERVVLMKAARIGFTVLLLASICFWFGQRRRHVTIYQPDDKSAARFAKMTVLPALRDCDQTGDMLDDVQHNDLTLALSRIGGKILRCLGAVSPSRFREFTSDSILLDEADALKRDIGGEGNPVELAARAIRNSPFRRLIVGGTPTDMESSLLYDEFMKASLRFYFFVPCPECGHEDVLLWENMEWPGKEEGHSKADAAAQARMVCQECGSMWAHGQLRKALRGGQWRVPDTTRVLACQRNDEESPEEFAGHVLECTDAGPMLRAPDGGHVDWPQTVALHINALYSPWWSWPSCVLEWLKAQGDVTKLKTFTNLTLGEPWMDTGTAIYVADLKRRREPLSPLPASIRRITAGVDVQEDRLSMLLVAWAADEVAHIFDRMEIVGDTSIHGAGAWLDFEEWLGAKPSWEVADGTRQPLDAVGLDTGYHTQTCYREVARLRSVAGRSVFLMPIKGSGTKTTPLVQRLQTRGKVPGASVVLYSVNRYQSGRVCLNRLAKEDKVKIGDLLTDQVINELCSTAVEKRRQPSGAVSLELVAHGRDEAIDCFRYALACLRTMQIDWSRKRRLKSADADKARNEEDVVPAPVVTRNPAHTARRRLQRRPRRRGAW